MRTRLALTVISAALFLAALTTPSFAVNEITNIVMTPPSPDIMDLNVNVEITCDYQTDVANGVQIFFRPYTDGFRTLNSAGNDSAIHPVGSGVATGWFTIGSGSVTVDSVRVQMWDPNLATLVLEFFIPVTYYYGPTPVTNIVMDPVSPAILAFGGTVSITFDYETIETSGVLIWARPFTMGSLSPNFAASGSPTYPVGMGSGSASFRIEVPPSPLPASSGALSPVIVDQIRFQMRSGQGVLVAEFFIPVSFTYDQSTAVEATTWGRVKAKYGN